jgi:predicted tellurium resistance membrane protein TerC
VARKFAGFLHRHPVVLVAVLVVVALVAAKLGGIRSLALWEGPG